ncbi:MAG TPA: glycosyltransferase [Oligoflexia bacterium]|mgnify:CR=1 FL=1|nr:glycosyltransferase [Oligoflexia bacterium]HMP49540.1 glycosyltransferase [Oligoflexia bacterium]
MRNPDTNDSQKKGMTNPRVDQFVHTLQYGDAISGEALTLRRVFSEMGYRSNIYSVNTHEKLAKIPLPYSSYAPPEKEEAALTILHYSIASPLNSIFENISTGKRAIIYHNLTPVSWYENYNARVANDLVRGIEELPLLLKKCDMIIADSEFNKKELLKFGAEKVHVLPLTLDPDRWPKRENPGIVAALKNHSGGTGKNILHVGRFAPNKCIEDIIRAFYFYHHKFEQNSRLWLVGSDTDTEIYSFELKKLARELRLNDAVNFVGSVSDDELMAFFMASDAYICMSEHEGFCVPIIEALNFSLPVIAFSSSAIPETLGDGGILLEEKNPLKTAAVLHSLISDISIKNDLLEKGKKQLEKFSLPVFIENINNTLLPLL